MIYFTVKKFQRRPSRSSLPVYNALKAQRERAKYVAVSFPNPESILPCEIEFNRKFLAYRKAERFTRLYFAILETRSSLKQFIY